KNKLASDGVKEGYDAATGAIKSTTNALGTLAEKAQKVYRSAIKEAKDWATEREKWEQKIADLSLGFEDKIREARRQTMTEDQQTRDIQLQALEKQKEGVEKITEAEELSKDASFNMAHGNEELARQYLEQSNKAYDQGEKLLNQSGALASRLTSDNEVLNAQAIKQMESVRDSLKNLYTSRAQLAGELEHDFKTQAENMKKLLDELAEARVAEVEITLTNLEAMEAELARLTRDRTLTVTVKEVSAKSFGGLMAAGGKTGRLWRR
ncbi:unnamed protein product, partial [marine sediment metagenome]